MPASCPRLVLAACLLLLGAPLRAAVADPPAAPATGHGPAAAPGVKLAPALPLPAPSPATAPAAPAAVAFTLFELDGNAMQDALPSPPDDWALLYDGGLSTGGHSAAFSGIVADPGNLTIFDGGKKDTQDISQWGFKNSGGFPDKNDITNAYAAAYKGPGDDLIVYFGADRFANSGDAFLGFWFFKSKVTADPATGKFVGAHSIGDVLVLVNYPQGATATPELQVLEWNPPLADVAPNLRLRYSNVGPVCTTDPPGTVCATTNLVPQASPWPYVPKAGGPGVFPPESFFEGGINLSSVLQDDICFSSFMAETRSSTSITATLKDFVLGDFPVCSLDVEKTCAVTSLTRDFTGFVVEFEATVSNTGAGTFPAGSQLKVTDDAGTPGVAGDDVVIVQPLAVPLGPGGEVTVSGQFLSATNPPLNTVRAEIQTPKVVVTSDPYAVECLALDLNPALELSKSCSLVLVPQGGKLVARVMFSGHVANTGDLPLVVTVTDDKAGPVLPATLLVPGQSLPLAGYYDPVGVGTEPIDPAAAIFSDTFTAVGTNPLLREPVVEMVSANCPLCPGR